MQATFLSNFFGKRIRETFDHYSNFLGLKESLEKGVFQNLPKKAKKQASSFKKLLNIYFKSTR